MKRFGLEPFSNSVEDFSSGVKQGKNVRVGYKPEQDGGKLQYWYLCKLNQKDGEDEGLKGLRGMSPRRQGGMGSLEFSQVIVNTLPKGLMMFRNILSRIIPESLMDFIFKCAICSYENKSITDVRKHMDTCTAITAWLEGGCDPHTINAMFVKNISHWTGPKIGGLVHFQKFEDGSPQKLLDEVRELTAFLDVKDVETMRQFLLL